jgi:hypothetical protein
MGMMDNGWTRADDEFHGMGMDGSHDECEWFALHCRRIIHINLGWKEGRDGCAAGK